MGKRRVEKPGFEIFKDIINSAKGKCPPLPDTITEADIDDLMKNLGLESKTENLNCDEVATILESSIDDILFEDTTTEDDLYTFSLFETDDVMNSKVNAMKSNFACSIFFLMVVYITLIKILAYSTFIPYALNHLTLAQKMNHAFCIF